MSLIFIVKEASDLDRVRGKLLTGPPGAAFRDAYLKPLGLTRSDVQVMIEDVYVGQTFDTPHTLIALGKGSAQDLQVDFRLPHPAAVERLGIPESLTRKLRAIRKVLDKSEKSTLHSHPRPESQAVAKSVPIIKADAAKQIVYAVVLDPYEVDLQNDWVPPSQVEATAHDWMQKSRVIGLDHSDRADAYPVETWIVPYPTEDDYLKAMAGEEHRAYLMPFGESKVRSGAWIVGTKLGDKEWALYKSGEIDAYSIGAYGVRTEVQKKSMPKVLWIDLLPSDPSAPTQQAPEVPNP